MCEYTGRTEREIERRDKKLSLILIIMNLYIHQAYIHLWNQIPRTESNGITERITEKREGDDGVSYNTCES